MNRWPVAARSRPWNLRGALAARIPDATAVFPHPGEEFLLVLKGAIEVQVGERQFRLDAGDSLYFDSELPHRMRTVGRTQAEALWWLPTEVARFHCLFLVPSAAGPAGPPSGDPL